MACWLMKAEPDSRIVKGKDVKFSVDDFEANGTTAWEGVRNHEAKNLMREMAIGDHVLFYHSNCKSPGIAGFATMSKLAHPDYTAWDASHPYFDPKSDQASPRWYMVELAFARRASHFVSLALLKDIASSRSPPSGAEYIGEAGANAIADMSLVGRGRLSVQRVSAEAWTAVEALADKGGWAEEAATGGKKKAKKVDAGDAKAALQRKGKRVAEKTNDSDEDAAELDDPARKKTKLSSTAEEQRPVRRSTRVKK